MLTLAGHILRAVYGVWCAQASNAVTVVTHAHSCFVILAGIDAVYVKTCHLMLYMLRAACGPKARVARHASAPVHGIADRQQLTAVTVSLPLSACDAARQQISRSEASCLMQEHDNNQLTMRYARACAEYRRRPMLISTERRAMATYTTVERNKLGAGVWSATPSWWHTMAVSVEYEAAASSFTPPFRRVECPSNGHSRWAHAHPIQDTDCT